MSRADRKFVNFSMRLPTELYEKIKVAAELDKRSIHQKILMLIEQSLSKNSSDKDVD